MTRKNRIQDLNDHLFAALEGLNDDDLTGDALDSAMRRAAAVVGVSDAILRVADTRIRAAKVISENGIPASNMLKGLTYDADA